ncbi:MAG: FAD-binding domain-containing protein, partial [Candidatus Omnitrophica bacterium]|nr:FAD-binding domain-containing protein [Candidatus Omnitrophota bacterium]
FNPILQAKKFDPQGIYIKKYIPELKDQPISFIHDPLNYKLKYYKPIVDHFKQISLFRRIYFKDFL